MKSLIVAAMGLLLGASATLAAPMSGDSLQSRFAGAELRMSVSGPYHEYEHHLWRFRADGTVHGYIYYVRMVNQGSDHVELSDVGRWRVDGDRICVDWRTLYSLSGNSICFTVDEQAESHVSLTTDIGRRWDARLHPWRGSN